MKQCREGDKRQRCANVKIFFLVGQSPWGFLLGELRKAVRREIRKVKASRGYIRVARANLGERESDRRTRKMLLMLSQSYFEDEQTTRFTCFQKLGVLPTAAERVKAVILLLRLLENVTTREQIGFFSAEIPEIVVNFDECYPVTCESSIITEVKAHSSRSRN